jgi:hypothetical protein
MEKLGLYCNDKRIKYRFCKYLVATVRMEEGRNIKAKIDKGVRQGYNRSPALVNMCIEEAIKGIEEQGIKLNGEEINMLRFADDIAIAS